MKKQLLLTCITLLSLTAAKAQKIYVKAGGGYMAPLAGQTFSATRWPYNGTVVYSAATGEISSYDIKGASFGAGVQGIIGIGLNVGKHAAFELNASVGIAPKTFSGTESYPAANGLYISETDKLQPVMPVILNPAVVLKTSGDLYLYTRVGLLLPLATKMKGEFEGSFTQNYIPGEYAGKLEYKTGFSAGATGSVVLSVKLSGD